MLPVMIDVCGKQVTIVGGGKVAFRKLSVFLEQRARITVISPEVVDEIKVLHEENKISWFKREVASEDVRNAFIVIAATNKRSVNEQVKKYSEENQLLCVVDNGDCGNMQMVSFKQKGNLTIAVSTGGASPFLAKKLTNQLSQPFDDLFIEKLAIISSERKEIKASDLPEREKRNLLKELSCKLEGIENE
ncbi:NAD(P)-dependent oxidoreductase [Bacillus sp. es.034]|jgi:precorrin-2 dehydrogenase / sirohydrochlorin ferrochelatase|uniref:precorrin-2 dehydrogenase/sirohydrochlorin ferrochelatase family protein n=1 Tax=Bacillus sp. es.034 TaxID=1761763 RepID=UPI000C01B535|nr:NAD(P)-dependent oxidoreductase [Bacillus sp. es.034]PFG06274.1 precorrin-2 dehydrogenase/sirohydrochlorin ferrochelatase [Bacillus sp. es.034]